MNKNRHEDKRIKTVQAKQSSKSALRRQREKELRVHAILKAAETLFAQNGYHATSMEEIADICELSVGTLYFYFKNKEDLLLNLMDSISHSLRKLVGNAFKESHSTLEGFTQAGKTFFLEFCQKEPQKIRILLGDTIGQGTCVESKRDSIFENLITDIKGALLRVGDNKKIQYQSEISADVMAVSIVGMFERIAYQYFVKNRSKNNLELITHDISLFIMGGVNNLMITP